MNRPSFDIGAIRISPPTVLAPLAGITTQPFRAMARHAGCGLVCSEMISAKGLMYGSQKTREMMGKGPGERPLSIQIFGSDPEAMALAAGMAEEAGADILDINFGCSVKKVIKTGSGVALMREPERSTKILTAVRRAITIPLTIKIRSGWETSGKQAFAIAAIAEDCGVDAICLHPRTAGQGFRGQANWPLIAALKERLTVPLIGNGDITSPEDARRMIHETGCDGVMIGRAALSDPDIFRRTALCLQGRSYEPLPLDEHFSIIERYISDSLTHHGETVACKMMKSRLGFLVKGLPGCSSFRKKITAACTAGEVYALLDGYKGYLNSHEAHEQLERDETKR